MYRPIGARRSLGVMGAGFVLFLAACGTQGTSPSEAAESSEPEPVASASGASGEVVEIEWFVGLGTGENEEQIPTEEEVVAAFNDANPNIHLTLTVVDNTEAATTLAARLPSDPPDIIGPIGIRGLQSFGDQLLDVGPYIESSGVDLSEIPQALIDVYNVDGKQIGIPMAVYPSFIYYNKTLFDEAQLAYPPHEVGEQYEGQDWTWETLRELALQLTVDANGNDATSAEFDPENVEVYGLDAQFTENDTRAWSTIFGGSGSVVADDGSTAQWPDNWREGLQFFYDGIWVDHIIPNQTAVQALADGNTFQSGLVAMDVVHQWYTCCVYPGEGDPPVTDWDIAVLPVGPDGVITSKLHADTIGILDSTEHPDEAFEVLRFLAASPELTQVWGALPAIESQREAFFAGLDERFAPLEIDWNVSTQMLEFPDNPSHEAFMPSFDEADSANKDFGSRLWNTGGLDLAAEIDAHVQLLQGIFDEGT
ncbi:MAG: ABC transporter substrate-binding protein [Candidatus Limnocylindria bacterium]